MIETQIKFVLSLHWGTRCIGLVWTCIWIDLGLINGRECVNSTSRPNRGGSAGSRGRGDGRVRGGGAARGGEGRGGQYRHDPYNMAAGAARGRGRG